MKIKNVLLVLVMSLVMIFSSTSAFACDITEAKANSQGVVSTADYTNTSTNISSTWTTVRARSAGINANLSIRVIGTDIGSTASIRMLDKNNNILWSSIDTVACSNDPYKFWCGSDVCKVQMRISSGYGTVFVTPAS